MFDSYSRLSFNNLYDRRGTLMHKNNIRKNIGLQDSVIHEFRSGDRLDLLSFHHYNTYELGWAILQANPKYRSEYDIKCGDTIIIPHYLEVMKCLKS